MSTFLDVQVPGELLTRARGGDRQACEHLYSVLARPTYTLLRRLVVRPALAEELLQDVFVEVLRSLSSFSGAGSFAGWVRSIAVSKALMLLRSPWQGQLLPEDSGVMQTLQVDPPVDSLEWSGDLERALNALPPVSRGIVWLHDVEGYTHAEIAQLFGRTTSFSKSQLARAHQELRERLEYREGMRSCMQASTI